MYNRCPRKAVTHVMERNGEGEEVEEEEEDAEEEEEEKEEEEEEEEEDAEDLDAVLDKLLKIREKCHLKAKENICAAQQKQKRQYDKKHNALKVRWWLSCMHAWFDSRKSCIPIALACIKLCLSSRNIQLVPRCS